MTPQVHGLNQYRRAQQDTAGPEESIALIYDGARRYVDKALLSLEAGDLYEFSQYTGKAQQILTELAAALNPEAGPMAENLFKLYDYWIWRLSQGLMQREPEAYREVSAVLVEMRDTWAEAARLVRAQRAGVAHG